MTTKRCTCAVTAALAASVAVLMTSSGLTAWAHPDPAHDEGTHQAPAGMSVKLTTSAAPGGVLVRLATRKFIWAPEHLSPVHGAALKSTGTTEVALINYPPTWTYCRCSARTPKGFGRPRDEPCVRLS